MKNQCFNPFLPSWEYIPDGEPHVFGDRVYIYGSHDMFNGWVFCINDYICYSAPVDDLSDWKYEGVIYERNADPLNKDGKMCLYAPDVTRGSDGRYYLYYVLDRDCVVSVAVCDTPAGKYKFHGYVKYPDGTLLGKADGDEPQFDPGVLTEGDVTYLYTGFCGHGDKSRSGCMATVLEADMLTVKEPPVFVIPSDTHSAGTGFEGNEIFEAPSIRKFGDTYYLVYSSVKMTNLSYATSKHPTKDFVYGGVIISCADLGIDTYKPADKPANVVNNNHGGIEKIGENYYIFYHRHTNGTPFSRQACVEKIAIETDGSIAQVEATSQGANGAPLLGKGEYPAYIACNLFYLDDCEKHPKLTQDGKDGDEELGYVTNIHNGAVIGFKYFDCKGVQKITVKTRGYGHGAFDVRLSPTGETLGSIKIDSANQWTEFSGDIAIPDGVHALYFVYCGGESWGMNSLGFGGMSIDN
ncbi:MAG: family 43 glycosylhydrolase [Oscillospiraceae bacterium]|nr:family 43 glycosylhydrolase [Oscillospiraceae bacterium]